MMFAQNLFYKKNFFGFKKKKKERNKGMKGIEAWDQTGKPRRERPGGRHSYTALSLGACLRSEAGNPKAGVGAFLSEDRDP